MVKKPCFHSIAEVWIGIAPDIQPDFIKVLNRSRRKRKDLTGIKPSNGYWYEGFRDMLVLANLFFSSDWVESVDRYT